MYYAFGEVDLVGIIDFPTPEDAAGFAWPSVHPARCGRYRTTPLLSVEQGISVDAEGRRDPQGLLAADDRLPVPEPTPAR